jgi:hypothetical protein
MSERGNDQSHTAVLLEKNGRFFFYQPDTGVISSDDSLEGAYAKFASARRKFLDDVEKSGLTLGVPSGAAPVPTGPSARGTAAELKVFLAKTCIVLLVVAVVGGLAATLVARSVSGIAGAINQALAPLKSITLGDVAGKAADVAKDAQSLTKQQKESLRQSIATISRELAPIAEAWRNPPDATQPSSNSETRPAPTSPGR